MTIEKMTAADGQSKNLLAENIEQLKRLFPEVITEGPKGQTIDFDHLRRLLGDQVEESEERFGLNWHGKARAKLIAQQPSTGTLRPMVEESVNWDTTQNLFIEGDNLEVLKLLQKSYHQKVKMIYIDPPYNTGKEFIYPDKFDDNLDTYLRYTGQKDDEGRSFGTNTETSGRYHTNWLNMIYPRLKLARNLLREDGCIFISIDDHEVDNLRLVCDEVFGEANLLAHFVWRTDGNFDNQAKFKNCHEYILLYAKDALAFPHPPAIAPGTEESSKLFRPEIVNTIIKNGPKNPPSSVTLPKGFPAGFESGVIQPIKDRWPKFKAPIQVKDGKLLTPAVLHSGWSSRDLLLSYISSGFESVYDSKGQATTFRITNSGAIEAIKARTEKPSHVITMITGVGGSQRATAELERLGIPFDDYPKPTDLIRYFVKMQDADDFIALDFFAGSGCTAHAVSLENESDGGKRRCISIQLPESTNKGPEYRTISEILRKRLVAVSERIESGDAGFRALKLSSSNLLSWSSETEDLIASTESLKADRSELDIVFEILLKTGLDLSLAINEHEIAGRGVYEMGAGALMVCLAKTIDLDLVEGIGALHDELAPEVCRVVFRDAGFADDATKTNAVQILKRHGIEDVKSL